MNDDTASGGQRSEADIRTCTHCQAIIKMQEWRKIENGAMTGGWCTRCMAPICHHCQKRMQQEGCVPFIARIEREFDAVTKLKQFRKLAGLDEPAPPPVLFTGVTSGATNG
jgi:hypothetical protein